MTNPRPPAPAMTFEIHLGKGEHLHGATVTARAATLAKALDFICEFYEGPLILSWVERDGSYLLEVYDLFDAPPVRARVITPRGFRPPESQTWFRSGFGREVSPAVDE